MKRLDLLTIARLALVAAFASLALALLLAAENAWLYVLA